MKRDFKSLGVSQEFVGKGYAVMVGDEIVLSPNAQEVKKQDVRTVAVGFMEDSRLLLELHPAAFFSKEAIGYICEILKDVGFKTWSDRLSLPIVNDDDSKKEYVPHHGRSLILATTFLKRQRGFGKLDVPPVSQIQSSNDKPLGSGNVSNTSTNLGQRVYSCYNHPHLGTA